MLSVKFFTLPLNCSFLDFNLSLDVFECKHWKIYEMFEFQH